MSEPLAALQAYVDHKKLPSRAAVKAVLAEREADKHELDCRATIIREASGQLARQDGALCAEKRRADALRRLVDSYQDQRRYLFDVAWIMPRAWMLYALSALGGFMAHG